MKFKEKIKKQVKGITLIALVVTIIVLLILAGVAINLTIGQNGIFIRAQNATEIYKNKSLNENLEMEKTEDIIDEIILGKITYEKEDVNIIASYDNIELNADIYNLDIDSNKWIILVHGYGGTKEDTNSGNIRDKYISKGYNVITPQMRYEIGSEDYTFGWIESNDLLDWITYIINNNENAEILLHGFSMGAAAVTVLSGNENLPTNVKGIIADSGAKDLNSFIEYLLKNNKEFLQEIIGETEIKEENELRQEANEIITERLSKYNLTIEQISAINQVRKAFVPMLFLHGEEDKTTNPEDSKELYEAATNIEKKKIKIFQGMGHCWAAGTKKDEYWSVVKEFIKEIE